MNNTAAHSVMVDAILRNLRAANIAAWKNSPVKACVNGRWVQYGIIGQADISGLLPDGRRLEIEVKTGKGKQTPAQKMFENTIRRNNGVFVLAGSVEDAMKAVNG